MAPLWFQGWYVSVLHGSKSQLSRWPQAHDFSSLGPNPFPVHSPHRMVRQWNGMAAISACLPPLYPWGHGDTRSLVICHPSRKWLGQAGHFTHAWR